ncbi:ABC transporter substrate-binding protein [Mesorhizobium sp. ANAO-SY3R2]|uniref:ABC transporter substrate-binding protein n=1 Tax=Mesorhizobium sp. ANAO-SY3R2 TaxID=3166644 RepID=UPI00366BE868
MKMRTRKSLLSAGLVLGILLPAPALAQDALTIANMSFRTGPYAATGTPLANGQRDYITMLNERDGGVNGIRLNFNECETGFNTDKGVECYGKIGATSIIALPWSPGTTTDILPKAAADKRPLLVPGAGFSAMSDGKTFPFAFNPPVTFWDGATMIMKNIAGGDLDTLRGKKIVLLYLDSPYGEEPIALLKEYAETFDFTLLPIAVGVKEMQSQAEQWARIKDERPDFVLLWGWGAMNAGAFAGAAKAEFPMDRLVGIWWSGSDEDLKVVGEAAKGYRVLSWNLPASDSQTLQDIRKYVVATGKSQAGPEELDGLLYQRGALVSMFAVEAVKAAQEHFETRLISAEQMRWGLENLKLDADALVSLGTDQMIGPFSTSCGDHAGHAAAWMLQWDGARFVKASDSLGADPEMIAPLVETEAKKFADSHTLWPLNGECKI